MTNEPRDEALRYVFAELREADRRSLPPFDGRVGRPDEAAVRARRRPAALLAAAAASLVAVAAGLATLVSTGRVAVTTADRAGAALVDWRSPTEPLLFTFGRELTRELPRVVAVDPAAVGLTQRGAKDRDSAPLNIERRFQP